MKRLLVVLAVMLSASAASAGGKKKPAPAPAPAPAPPPPPAPAEVTPWSQGIPQDRQDAANQLYEEGNQLFGQQAHAPALEKYRAAVAIWDHPLINFNLAVTLIRLDRILEAADALDKALAYGAAPYKSDLYLQALDYQALVKGRVAYIEADCKQAGAHIQLDGKPWFDCPGTKKVRVMAGEHAIVTDLPGFLTSSRKIVAAGGATTTEHVALVPIDTAVVLTYPYRRWIPWTTTIIGIGVAAAGGATWLLGRNSMSQFNADYATQCRAGCETGLTAPAHHALASELDSAQLKSKVGVAMMAGGGVVAVTGLVLAIMNRPTRKLPTVEVAPQAGGAMAMVGWSY